MAVALLCMNPGIANAAVSLSVRPGLNGIYKVEQPVTLSIEVANTGPEFAGVIEVKPFEESLFGYRANQEELAQKNMSQISNNQSARFKMEILVPAGAKKEFQMVIPGDLAVSLPAVELLSEGVTLAYSRVEGAAVSGNRVVLALSEDIMGSGLQTWAAEGNGPPIALKYLPAKSVPQEVGDLMVADLIMADAASAEGLTKPQVRALNDWVHLGGWLVLFGSTGGIEDGLFADLSPVRVTGSKQITGTLGGLRSGGPVTVATGDLVDAKALIAKDGVPVLANRSFGRGQVLYCGIAPGQLGKEMPGIWSILTGNATGIQVSGEQILFPEKQNLSRDYLYSLVDASSYISQLKGPSEELLFGLWLIYIVAIGPLLYLILRRFDRRDWAWGVIPAGALLATLGFYMLAPSHRIPGQLAQTLASVDILAPQLAEIHAGATLVSAHGGDLAVQGADGMYMVPANNQGSLDGGKGVVYQGAENFRVEFSDVKFGSLRQVYASGIERNLGSIEGKLYLTGDKLKGQLVNKTRFNLRDAQLVFDGKVITIGNFSANETKIVDEMLIAWETAGRSPEFFPVTGPLGPDDPYVRERRMMDGPMGVEISRMGVDMSRAETVIKGGVSRVEASLPENVQFLGWYDGSPELLSVTGSGSETQDYGLILVKQELQLELIPGKVRLPAGMVKPQADKIKGVSFSSRGIELYENIGYLTYNLANLGGKYNFEVTGLEFPAFLNSPGYSMEIRNQSVVQWEPLPYEGLKLGPEDIGRYLTPDQNLEIRLIRRNNYTESLPFSLGPAVEGVVSE